MKRTISVILALALVLGFSLLATTPVAAAVIPVVPGIGTIAAAIPLAGAGGIIQLTAPGIYWEGHITIPWNLTIMGMVPGAIIHPAGPLQADGWASSWFLVNPGVTFVMQNVVMDGTPAFVHQAVRNHGNAVIQNVGFINIQGAPGSYKGVAIQSYGGLVVGGAGSDSHGVPGMPPSSLQVTGCTFSGMGRIGVLVKGNASTATITGCTYTGKGNSADLDYGVEVGAGGAATITGNTITSCGVSASGWGSAGILVTTYYGAGTTATITGNTITGNEYGIAIGYDAADTSVVTAHFNTISGNNYGADSTSGTVTTDAECNYWGAADGPQPTGSGNPVSGNVSYAPWLTTLPNAPQKSVTPTTGGTAYFTPDQGGIGTLTAVPTPPAPPVTLPYGVFNFTICCFTGPTVTLNITLPGPVQVGTRWYKYVGGSWYSLPIGSDNGDNFITVTLQDNVLPDDEDPIAYQILDQGGPGEPGAGGAVGWETYAVSKIRVLLPWIALLAAIAAGASLLVVRRRRAQS